MPRIKVSLTPSTSPISFNYQHSLAGFIHKVLGENDWHDEGLSLYNFSWLYNLKPVASKNFLVTREVFNPYFYLSSYDNLFLNLFCQKASQKSPSLFGMQISAIEYVDLDASKDIFYPQSPIFLREARGSKYLYYDDANANERMKGYLEGKLKKACIKYDDFDIRFEHNPKAKTKSVIVKGLRLKGSVCPVRIDAEEKIKIFAMEVGLGGCTGIGFGCIK